MLAKRIDTASDLAAAAMEVVNRFTNHGREYWYIGSMLARSATGTYDVKFNLLSTQYEH